MIRLAVFFMMLVSFTERLTFADMPGLRAAAFSPDGKLFAACSSPKNDGGQLAVWDAQSWEL